MQELNENTVAARPGTETRAAVAGPKKKAPRTVAIDTRPVKNEGEQIEPRPLTPWEAYTQSLLFTNEVTFVK